MNKDHLLILFFSLGISFSLYGNTIKGDFVGDDVYFSDRPELRQISNLPKIFLEPIDIDSPNPTLYRPLTVLTFSLNYILFGESPISFHIVNIVLNGLAGFLIYIVVKELFRSDILAIFTAVIFLFLPIHTEAVANIKGREELLATVLILISWILFMRKKFFLSASVWFLAVLAKEFMITTPAIFLLALFLKEKKDIRNLARVALLFVPFLISALSLRYIVLGEYAFGKDNLTFVVNPLQQAPVMIRIFTAFKLAFYYIVKTFIPHNLSATYSYNHLALVTNLSASWEGVLGLLLLGALLVCLLVKKVRQGPIAVGSLIFLVSYSIFSKFIFAGGDYFAERWMYFPSLGLVMILAGILNKFKVRVEVLIVLIICLIYASIVIPRNKVWLAEKNLAESLVKDAPDSVRARTVYTQYLLSQGDFKKAKEQIDEGMKIYSQHPRLLELASVEAFYRGDYRLAKEYSLIAVDMIRPPGANTAYIIYALVLSKERKYEESLEIVDKILEMTPARPLIKKKSGEDIFEMRYPKDNPGIKFVKAVNYYKLGQIEEAKKYFDWNPDLTEEEKIELIEDF